jgi:hypothetical protein
MEDLYAVRDANAERPLSLDDRAAELKASAASRFFIAQPPARNRSARSARWKESSRSMSR